jgi:hypothetical protein
MYSECDMNTILNHQFQNDRRGTPRRVARGRSTTVTVRSTVLGCGSPSSVYSSTVTSTTDVGAGPGENSPDRTNSSGAGRGANLVGAGLGGVVSVGPVCMIVSTRVIG